MQFLLLLIVTTSFISNGVIFAQSNLCTFEEDYLEYVPKIVNVAQKVEKKPKSVLSYLNPMNLFSRGSKMETVQRTELILEKRKRKVTTCCRNFVKIGGQCVSQTALTSKATPKAITKLTSSSTMTQSTLSSSYENISSVSFLHSPKDNTSEFTISMVSNSTPYTSSTEKNENLTSTMRLLETSVSKSVETSPFPPEKFAVITSKQPTDESTFEVPITISVESVDVPFEEQLTVTVPIVPSAKPIDVSFEAETVVENPIITSEKPVDFSSTTETAEEIPIITSEKPADVFSTVEITNTFEIPITTSVKSVDISSSAETIAENPIITSEKPVNFFSKGETTFEIPITTSVKSVDVPTKATTTIKIPIITPEKPTDTSSKTEFTFKATEIVYAVEDEKSFSDSTEVNISPIADVVSSKEVNKIADVTESSRKMELSNNENNFTDSVPALGKETVQSPLLTNPSTAVLETDNSAVLATTLQNNQDNLSFPSTMSNIQTTSVVNKENESFTVLETVSQPNEQITSIYNSHEDAINSGTVPSVQVTSIQNHQDSLAFSPGVTDNPVEQTTLHFNRQESPADLTSISNMRTVSEYIYSTVTIVTDDLIKQTISFTDDKESSALKTSSVNLPTVLILSNEGISSASLSLTDNSVRLTTSVPVVINEEYSNDLTTLTDVLTTLVSDNEDMLAVSNEIGFRGIDSSFGSIYNT